MSTDFCKFRDHGCCCFCLIVIGAAANPEVEQVMRCCWCGETKMHTVVWKPVEGHGPRRHTVTYEPK